MGRFFILFLMIPLFFCSMLYFNITMCAKNQKISIENQRLAITMDYGAEAAAEEMLRSGDLGMDHTDWSKFTVNPVTAREMFNTMICLGYNMAVGEENFLMIENVFTPVFIVAGYDGYYLATPIETVVHYNFNADGTLSPLQPTNVGQKQVDSVFTPKMPYSYKHGDKLYALNMGREKCFVFDKTLKTIDREVLPLTKDKIIRQINMQLTDVMSYAIDRVYQQGFIGSLYLPDEITAYNSTNPVSGPTVMCLMDNFNLTTTEKLKAFSISGAKATNARMVAVYQRGGIKYYCYSDLLPQSELSKVENLYTSVQEAAENGYMYDPEVMD